MERLRSNNAKIRHFATSSSDQFSSLTKQMALFGFAGITAYGLTQICSQQISPDDDLNDFEAG